MIVVHPLMVISVPERILLQVGQASRESLSLSVSFLCPIAAVILAFFRKSRLCIRYNNRKREHKYVYNVIIKCKI